MRTTVDPVSGKRAAQHTALEVPLEGATEVVQWRWVELSPPSLPSPATSMIATVGHLAVAAGPAGLWRWDGFAWTPTRLPEQVGAGHVRAVARLTERRYLLAGTSGLVSFLSRGKWRVLIDDRSRDRTMAWAGGGQRGLVSWGMGTISAVGPDLLRFGADARLAAAGSRGRHHGLWRARRWRPRSVAS